MARARRRDRLNPAVRTKSAILSVALALFMLFACLAFFFPRLDVDSRPFVDPFIRIRHLPIDRRSFRDLQSEEHHGNKKSASVGTLLEEISHSAIFHVPNDGVKTKYDLWSSNLSNYYYGCCNASKKFAAVEVITHPNRYLMIATSGGLNQQRTGITDAVVAARILNATLVVPKLDHKSFWKDSSAFDEIFDVDWFISSLSKDVKIVQELPGKGLKAVRGPYTMRVPRKCNPKCYQTRVLPVLLKKHVVQLTKFDYRLSNRLETDLQKLRCRVNYHALRFTNQIHSKGKALVHQMREKSTHFIALHLRFEPDMLAFSGCYYGGGDAERRELGTIRRRWKTLHKNNPDKERRHGKCPLTPEEVGLMLRALGFGKHVHLYVASGEVYGGKAMLAPLKALFPNYHSKETLAKKELAPFSQFSSRMAALDFIVCDESDVFVTNNNGNMARILAGRRRYFNHKRTIRPNARKLYSLFLNRANMTWESFSLKVQKYQRGFMGDPREVRPGRGEFHENPAACLCVKAEANLENVSISTNRVGGAAQERNTPRNLEIEDEESDKDESVLSNATISESDLEEDSAAMPEEQEWEEIFSD